jgi:Protein of unknown function (DUF2510)
MGWRDEPSVRPRVTITGKPVTDPEEIGTLARRGRMMAAAVRLLSEHKLAQADSIGTPVGDDYGMAELVERLRPMFATESSFTRWVALRGALLFLDMSFPAEMEWRSAMLAMGLEVELDPYSGERRVVPVDKSGSMTPHQKSGLVGLFHSIESKLRDYEKISSASISDVLAHPMCYVNELMALEYIAWTALAVLRTGNAPRVWGMPEPGQLEVVGWYADPLFAKGERYWDGKDWTARVRVKEGRRWNEGLAELG